MPALPGRGSLSLPPAGVARDGCPLPQVAHVARDRTRASTPQARARPDSMPFFHDQDRSSLRRMYVDAWRKHREQRVLEPLEAQIVALIGEHPEYHALLADDAALTRDWTPEHGAAIRSCT